MRHATRRGHQRCWRGCRSCRDAGLLFHRTLRPGCPAAARRVLSATRRSPSFPLSFDTTPPHSAKTYCFSSPRFLSPSLCFLSAVQHAHTHTHTHESAGSPPNKSLAVTPVVAAVCVCASLLARAVCAARPSDPSAFVSPSFTFMLMRALSAALFLSLPHPPIKTPPRPLCSDLCRAAGGCEREDYQNRRECSCCEIRSLRHSPPLRFSTFFFLCLYVNDLSVVWHGKKKNEKQAGNKTKQRKA